MKGEGMFYSLLFLFNFKYAKLLFMKKVTFIFFYTYFLSITSFAQINKGTTLLGGDFSFNSQTAKEGANKSKSNGFSFSPVFAKAVKQNTF